MKLRTAILMGGHLRTYRYALQSQKKYLFNKIKADLFIATWDRIDNPEPTWWRRTNRKNIALTKKTSIMEKYNPAQISIEKQPKLLSTNLDQIVGHKCYGLFYALSSLLRAYEISKSFGDYDRFICIRPDLELGSEIYIDEVEQKEVLFFPRQDYFTNSGILCDTWLICNKDYFCLLKNYKDKLNEYIFNNTRSVIMKNLIQTDKRKIYKN